MTDRTIRVRLEAQISGFRKAMRDASKDSDKLAQNFDRNGRRIDTAAGRLVRSAEVNQAAWTQAGGAITAFGVGGVVALGLSARAAVEWESAWTGVLKTVDGSVDQLERLEDDLRQMALVLPASAKEIAAVAEAAGQLGVQVDDVADFTRVMIDLGETTNLTADEAAVALARIANIMGTATNQVDRMGATIVDLGNNAATTEREIVELATRLAAAGRQAGLAEADVFAFASALTSVGVQAEAGGTALSKVFTRIADAARDGGEDLETFAEVAGVSAEEFQRAFDEDSARAIGLFVDGLGRLSQAGESTTAVFEELGLTDERLKRSLLSLGSAQGLLNEQLDIARNAWSDNTALVEEAAKRYDTTEAKLQIAKNSINEAAVVIGENLLPALAKGAEFVASFTQAFADLPEPVQKVLTGLGGLASVAALVAGSFLLVVPRAVQTVNAMKELAAISPRAASGLGRISKGAGVAAIALTALAATSGIPQWGTEVSAGAGEATQALLDVAEGAAFADTALGDLVDRGGFRDWFTGNDIDSLERAYAVLADPGFAEGADNVLSSILTLGQSTSTNRLQAEELFESLDQGLASLVASGNADKAEEALEALGFALDDVAEFVPDYVDALASADAETRLNVDAVESLSDTYESLNASLEDTLGLQRELAGIALGERAALSALEAAIDDAAASVDDFGATLDITTEEGRRNDAALRDIAATTLDLIEAQYAADATTADLAATTERGRLAFIAAAIQMGATQEEAETLADTYRLIPDDITTIVTADTSQASSAINALRGQYSAIQFANYSAARTNFATGGEVAGPGTSTSDSILAKLSNGEHVWSAREVAGAGGHAAMEAMRAAARGFANGGTPDPTVMSIAGIAPSGRDMMRIHPADLAFLAESVSTQLLVDGRELANTVNRVNQFDAVRGNA